MKLILLDDEGILLASWDRIEDWDLSNRLVAAELLADLEVEISAGLEDN